MESTYTVSQLIKRLKQINYEHGDIKVAIETYKTDYNIGTTVELDRDTEQKVLLIY